MTDERKRAESVIAVLEQALLDAHEALIWHDGLRFEPSGRDSKTIDLIIKEALRAQAAYRLRVMGTA